MKKSILSIALMVMTFCITSCGGNTSKSENNSEEPQLSTISVDEVLVNADNLVGDTVTIEGVCSHLCKHGGRKAFIVGSADSVMIRCEAFPLMGEAFSRESVHHPIAVTGILREQRIDEDAIVEMERQNTARLQNIESQQGDEAAKEAAEEESGCDTERAAQGQQNVTTFEERMADYRAKIAAKVANGGNPYLSYYYIDAISYKILPE